VLIIDDQFGHAFEGTPATMDAVDKETGTVGLVMHIALDFSTAWIGSVSKWLGVVALAVNPGCVAKTRRGTQRTELCRPSVIFR
jgi:hypothetical protein